VSCGRLPLHALIANAQKMAEVKDSAVRADLDIYAPVRSSQRIPIVPLRVSVA
jgi:hypothetical protein